MQSCDDTTKISHAALPESIPLKPAFLAVFAILAENGYAKCSPDNFDEKPDFDMAVSNCLNETLDALGLVEPEEGAGPWLGALYDWLDDAGYAWPEDDDETEESQA